MDKLLVFDIWGDYGHFKQIFATTSALTYPFPFKTAVYGMVGAIAGLPKEGNAYLKHFQPGDCEIGIQLLNPVKSQRIHINLSPDVGPIRGNRKPTLVELLHRPRYRIYFTHRDENIYNSLKVHLQEHTSVFTVSIGLANLLANFNFIGEFEIEERTDLEALIYSVILTDNISRLNSDGVLELGNEIVEVSQYALEMDVDRNVTKRSKVLYDRKGLPILAKVSHCVQIFDFPDVPILHVSLL